MTHYKAHVKISFSEVSQFNYWRVLPVSSFTSNMDTFKQLLLDDGDFIAQTAGIDYYQIDEEEHEILVPVYRLSGNSFEQVANSNINISEVIKCPTRALEICCYKPETSMTAEQFGDNFAASINQPSSEIVFRSSSQTLNGELLVYSVTENFRDSLVRAGMFVHFNRKLVHFFDNTGLLNCGWCKRRFRGSHEYSNNLNCRKCGKISHLRSLCARQRFCSQCGDFGHEADTLGCSDLVYETRVGLSAFDYHYNWVYYDLVWFSPFDKNQ